jgi:hypothetical protein
LKQAVKCFISFFWLNFLKIIKQNLSFLIIRDKIKLTYLKHSRLLDKEHIWLLAKLFCFYKHLFALNFIAYHFFVCFNIWIIMINIKSWYI